jgi:hypothetical protein
VGSINPAPNVYDWQTLDARVQTARDTESKKVITLCCGPTWMVDPNWNSGTDWDKLEEAILPEHEDDYAALAALVAQRYPDVEYFQVWNEMKGLWDSSANNWDYVRYTRLYNKIWTAVKQVRPDAKIGGPYLKIEGSGGATDLGLASHYYTDAPITERNKTVLNYWLAHKQGADFITIDRNSIDGDENWSDYPEDKRIKLTHWFGDVAQQIQSLAEYHNEPIWYAEDYIWKNADTHQPSTDYQNAAIASMLLHELKNGVSVSLRWQPQQNDLYKENLFTDTRVSGGGQALPAYTTYKIFHDNFAPGTPIYTSTVNNANVEVLASATHSLLINKSASMLPININGTSVTALNPYEVRLIDKVTSASPSPTSNQKVCDADIDQSGRVNLFDYTILLNNYRKTTLTNVRADISHDGKVNLFDYTLLLNSFSQECI